MICNGVWVVGVEVEMERFDDVSRKLRGRGERVYEVIEYSSVGEGV